MAAAGASSATATAAETLYDELDVLQHSVAEEREAKAALEVRLALLVAAASTDVRSREERWEAQRYDLQTRLQAAEDSAASSGSAFAVLQGALRSWRLS